MMVNLFLQIALIMTVKFVFGMEMPQREGLRYFLTVSGAQSVMIDGT